MDKNNICIATITWARNNAEENLLRTSLQTLAALNIPTFIADGGSPPGFISFVKEIPHFTVVPSKGKGLQAQVISSVAAAATTGTPYILYTEPDKQQFFAGGLQDFLHTLPAGNNAGVFLAARSADGFASYPAFQQLTETTINRCCGEVTGKPFDYTYGPFLMRASLVKQLACLTEDIGWGWRPYLFVLAARLGLSVEAFVGEYFCPPDQQADDEGERLYRMRQLEQNIRGVILAATRMMG